MGIFSIPLQVGDLMGERWIEAEAQVDTGSTYSMFPADVLTRLGVEPVERRPFQLADDSIVEYEVGEARIRLDGHERTVPVVFGPGGVTPLLGATALEIFLLAVDPIRRRLVPVPGLLR